MVKIQNMYDDNDFFNKYQEMRNSKLNANELIEIPTIKKMLPDLKGKTVLDLGCGAGEMSRYFIKNGAKKVVTIDISENMISVAKSQDSTNIDYRILPLEKIDQINEKFDLIFSSLAFHYIQDFNKLMKDIYNLLNTNGILLFSQENPISTAVILSENEKKYIEKNGKRYYLLSDYNNVSKRTHKTGLEFYHRNYETTINCIIKNGLNLIEICEPNAPEQAVKLVSKYEYFKDRPLFLYVKAQKL